MVPWICSRSVCLFRGGEGGTEFGRTPIQPRGMEMLGGGYTFGVGVGVPPPPDGIGEMPGT